MQKSIVKQIRDAGTYTPGAPRKINGGWNLTDVLRDIAYYVMDEEDWSQNELALQIGYNPSSVYRFLNGDRGTDMSLRLEFLTCLCARLGETPGDLFARHPVFQAKRKQKPVDEPTVHERLQGALDVHEARALLPLLEEAKFRGLTDLALNALFVTIETAKRSDAAAKGTRRAG